MKQQKEILQKEIIYLEEKKECLLKTRLMLDEEFFTLVEKAEKEQNLMLVIKATAMKRKNKDKKSEMEKIEKALDIPTKKKRGVC